MGRVAGSADGNKRHSDAMKSISIVWNEETLDCYFEKLFKIIRKVARLPGHGEVVIFLPRG